MKIRKISVRNKFIFLACVTVLILIVPAQVRTGNVSITCKELDCKIIFPDYWSGKYVYRFVAYESDNDFNNKGVLAVSNRKLAKEGYGNLFYIGKTNRVYTEGEKRKEEKEQPAPIKFFDSDKEGTFYIRLPSDLQGDTFEFNRMSSQLVSGGIEVEILNGSTSFDTTFSLQDFN